MMTEPIIPPPELVQQWEEDWHHSKVKHVELEPYIATRAAQWGADQELEACCDVLRQKGVPAWSLLRLHRRPKPPSLKEQALEALGPEPLPETGPTGDTILNKGSIERHRHIRLALEALPDE